MSSISQQLVTPARKNRQPVACNCSEELKVRTGPSFSPWTAVECWEAYRSLVVASERQAAVPGGLGNGHHQGTRAALQSLHVCNAAAFIIYVQISMCIMYLHKYYYMCGKIVIMRCNKPDVNVPLTMVWLFTFAVVSSMKNIMSCWVSMSRLVI